MSRESKILFVDDKSLILSTVKAYETFGWELLQINGNDIIMSRETQHTSYPELIKFESEHQLLVEKSKVLSDELDKLKYKPVRFAAALYLFFLFILPMFLYLIVKGIQKKRYLKKKTQLEKELFEVETQLSKIQTDSRVMFFAKQ